MKLEITELDTPKKQTICLNMIVKDEGHIIEKTLQNICNNIDITYWVISDTGSTDNTKEIIQRFLSEKKTFHERCLIINDLPDEVTGRIMSKFKLEWPDMLKSVQEGKRVNRPRINSRKMYKKLKEHLVKCKISEDKIWDEIKNSNIKMGMWSHKRLKCTSKTLDKARIRGFYFGDGHIVVLVR